ncbi:hypothetical protein K469DRAFT_746516 [Zopfia rhizophila CBS 207.26]|uniref:Uncharacterized protein n=1 Tax=Zopfia rhizophila CBS 207.26 TaxID=1314779 RepID=A0A6A6EK01_9PEZI|nr:hypothetical protein K469DRAFT_746516 [Zopfia rhizophila CBS 207.26]
MVEGKYKGVEEQKRCIEGTAIATAMTTPEMQKDDLGCTLSFNHHPSMEPENLYFDPLLLSSNVKRHVPIDGDDPEPGSKRFCAQPREWYYGDGMATASSHLLPSGGTQDDILYQGPMETLQQGSLDPFSMPQDEPGFMLPPDPFATCSIGGSLAINSCQGVHTQTSGPDADPFEFGFRDEMFVEGSRTQYGTLIGVNFSAGPFDYHNIEPDSHVSQQEAQPSIEPFPPLVKQEYVYANSDSRIPADDYTKPDFQTSLDSWTPVTSQITERSRCASNDEVYSERDENYDVSGAGSTQKNSIIVQYDTCFGVVVANATSSFTDSHGSKIAPVNIRHFGDILKLNFQDSNKYAGLLTLPALGKLLDEFYVKFTATLIASQSRPSQASRKVKVKDLVRTQECSVRIVVYGMKRDKSAVGSLLSDAGLYLQQPSAEECDRDVEYCNPHYLLRPGAQMPKLDELSISSNARKGGSSEMLDEVNKSRFMQIFDFANDVSNCLQVVPSSRLCSTLKDYQLTALAVMAEKECGIVEKPMFPSLWEITSVSGTTKKYRHKITDLYENLPVPVYGGILADEMGLGKTLSALALICSSLDMLTHDKSQHEDGISKATLVVTPKSTIPAWQEQIKRHIRRRKMRVAVYHGSTRRGLSASFKNHDIILTTYETLRSEWVANGAIYSENWYRLILDEAHHIRNRSSQIFKAACAIDSRYRWCLTGTPIHNSLDDYGALLSFIRVPPFTEKTMFDFWITSPIRHARPYSMRRLQDLLLPQSALDAWKARDSTSIDWQMMRNCRSRCDMCDVDIEEIDLLASDNPFPRCKHLICTACALGGEYSTGVEERKFPKCVSAPTMGVNSILPSQATAFIPPSSRIEALLRNLHSEQVPESNSNPERPVKSVIFSYWTKMLDLVQQKLKSNSFTFQRIDGGTSLGERSRAISQFNSDPACTIMLASIGSAGEGVDLTAASRVHLIEPHWSPMAEAQAVDRVHRIGQLKRIFNGFNEISSGSSVNLWIVKIYPSPISTMDGGSISRKRRRLMRFKQTFLLTINLLFSIDPIEQPDQFSRLRLMERAISVLQAGRLIKVEDGINISSDPAISVIAGNWKLETYRCHISSVLLNAPSDDAAEPPPHYRLCQGELPVRQKPA